MTLANILEEIAEQEYALPKAAPKHFFSFKHRRAMNKILYPDNLPKAEKKPAFKRRAVILAAIALLAVVTGAVSIIRHGGFWFNKERIEGYDYFIMHAENDKNAPKTIEKLCYNYNLPQKYKVLDKMCQDHEDYTVMYYYDSETTSINGGHPFVMVLQWTKQGFYSPVDTDEDVVEAIEVKGSSGFKIVKTIGELEYDINTVIWDCGEYIHVIVGTIPMEDIMTVIDGMTEK
ncbi:MAG: DUF4367 domain-containing protein [Oscillospiraceae bacterium]|nr:DUF4367 domain-containing protein [Oscillospiraceae bacterium]